MPWSSPRNNRFISEVKNISFIVLVPENKLDQTKMLIEAYQDEINKLPREIGDLLRQIHKGL